MALPSRLVLAALTVASVLGVYVLCVNLDRLGTLTFLYPAAAPPSLLSRPETRDHVPGDPGPPETGRAAPAGAGTSPPSAAAPRPAPDVPIVPHVPAAPHVPASKAPTAPKAPNPPAAPGPTEPAFIGDSYMSLDAPPQTDCKDSIRRRILDSDFGKRFLERIPVLQWAKHVTPAQYQRLSRYPGAHGWGGVDYKTLQETLLLLNSSASWQLLDDWSGGQSGCSRCAVVGNGGILKDSKRGKEIDGHHYVFRTNGAIIRGFEEDVGSRTTHYTFSTNTLMNSMRSYAQAGYRGPPVSPETRYVFLPDHDRDYLLVKAAAAHTPVERGRDKGQVASKLFGETVSARKLKMYHPDFIRYLRNRFLPSNAMRTKYRDIYRPSTGATMLLAALHSCDQVDAYGFMTPDFARYSDHYFDSSFHPVGFFINHDLRMEMQLWQQLHRAGLIRLYMRQ